MATMYEITADMAFLYQLMEQGELDQETLRDALSVSKEELAIKLEAYTKVIKEIEAENEAIKKEIERLTAKKKANENHIASMKEAMKFGVITAEPETKKIKTALFTFGVQKNAPSVVMDEQYIENIPAEYLRLKEPEVDKKKILEDLKAGKNLEGLAHLEQTSSLRIR